MTNVTYLPWVSPQMEVAGSLRESEPAPPLSALAIDELEQTLLRKLHHLDMSVREIQEWLRSRDAVETDANVLIEKCQRLGYIDDVRLAGQIVHKMLYQKKKSKQAIVEHLRSRGISRADIESALEEIDEATEIEHARQLAFKKVDQMTGQEPSTVKRRLMGFLVRRGYSSAIVRQVCTEALQRLDS